MTTVTLADFGGKQPEQSYEIECTYGGCGFSKAEELPRLAFSIDDLGAFSRAESLAAEHANRTGHDVVMYRSSRHEYVSTLRPQNNCRVKEA